MGEIDEQWVEELTKAIAKWFDDKVAGWNDILSEGLLVVPLAEFLLERNWKLSGERSKEQIFGFSKGQPYVSYDLCAEKGDGASCLLLIELKFLKPRKENGLIGRQGPAQFSKKRIEKDVRDLVGVSRQCKRLLVIGVHPKVTNEIGDIENIVKECAKGATSIVCCCKNGGDSATKNRCGESVKILSCYLEPARVD
jgi:hypothetical protein